MNCGEVQKFVYAYLDAEFDERDRGEFEAHLSICQKCRQMVDFEGWFRQSLKKSLPREQAPEQLRARIGVCLDGVEKERTSMSGWLGRWTIPGYVWKPAPALAALGMVAFLLWPTMGSYSLVLEDAVERHRRDWPVEVTGPDDAQIKTWFRGKVDFPVNLPKFDGHLKVNLLGARLSHLRDRQAAHVVYDAGGSKLSVMVFDGRGLRNPTGRVQQVGKHPVTLHSANGYSFAVFRDRGVTYTITSELDEGEILKLVSASLAHH